MRGATLVAVADLPAGFAGWAATGAGAGLLATGLVDSGFLAAGFDGAAFAAVFDTTAAGAALAAGFVTAGAFAAVGLAAGAAFFAGATFFATAFATALTGALTAGFDATVFAGALATGFFDTAFTDLPPLATGAAFLAATVFVAPFVAGALLVPELRVLIAMSFTVNPPPAAGCYSPEVLLRQPPSGILA